MLRNSYNWILLLLPRTVYFTLQVKFQKHNNLDTLEHFESF